jgi:hypothetical protein
VKQGIRARQIDRKEWYSGGDGHGCGIQGRSVRGERVDDGDEEGAARTGRNDLALAHSLEREGGERKRGNERW